MTIDRGQCLALFAYDVGLSIGLDDAERRITELTQREKIKRKHRAPAYLAYEDPPLSVRQTAPSIALGRFATAEHVSVTAYDFGAVCVTYAIPLSGPLSDLLSLSDELYDNAALLGDSRRRVEELLKTIQPAVTKPRITT